MDIVGPLVKIPLLRGAAVGPPVSTVVEVNNLCDVGKLREERLELGVIVAWPAVKEQKRGFLTHSRPIRGQLCPLDVKEKAGVSDLYPHTVSPIMGGLTFRVRGTAALRRVPLHRRARLDPNPEKSNRCKVER